MALCCSLRWSCIMIVALSPFWIMGVIILLLNFSPSFPSVSIRSMSVTVVNITSKTQVMANLELNFWVENNNQRTMVYDNVKVSAYHFKKSETSYYYKTKYYYKPVYSDEKLIDTFSLPPFEQQGNRNITVVVRMDNVSIEVDSLNDFNTEGTTYLSFEWMNFVRMKKGKWLKSKSNMHVDCEILDVVFPLNQTKRFDFEPLNTCDVDGKWGSIDTLLLSLYWIILVVTLLTCLCGGTVGGGPDT